MHFVVPGLIAYLFFNKQWKKIWLIFVLTMIIDLDHLVAIPLFSTSRCSINYHPFHSYYAIILYIVLLLFPKTRIIAIGLLFHMLTDYMDCLWIK
ncbi:MAG: hypothetical protein COC16_02445 [Lutibacter sp.]|nr:MAG: hypothetical protein COC16_02445 [Lutibacter sp.]